MNALRSFSGMLGAISFLAAGWSSATAATYHVSATGSNANSGLSAVSPWATLQHAANIAQPGDVVLVADGSYAGCNITRSGAAGSPITFRAKGQAAVIATPNSFTTRDGINIEGGDWIVIDGFVCSGLERAGIRAVNADHCVIRNNTCANNGRWGIFTGFTDDLLLEGNHCSYSGLEHGIYVSNSSDRAVIRNNRVHHNRGSGIQINADLSQGGDGLSSDCRIHDNVIWENGTAGGAAINLDGAVDARIFNNVLYENHATGIALFRIDGASSSRGAWIVNNTILQAANGRWCVLAVDGATGLTLRNNILVTSHTFRGALAMDAASRSGLSSNYNVLPDRMSADAGDSVLTLSAWRSSTGQDADSVVAGAINALFRDRAGGDFRLSAASVAVDAGAAVAEEGATRDAVGVGRPQGIAVDAGAFEHVPPAAADPSPVRVVNLSTRARTTPGEPVIAGFVVSGTGSCTVLIRVAGPALVPLGVPTALPDPELRLFAGGVVVAANDDWHADPQAGPITTTAAVVGAFPFADGSADSAILVTLEPGAYTVHAVTKTGASAGVVLVELYDATPEPATARLANVSTRALAGHGDATAVAGFVTKGAAGSLLMRAVGPGLADFGVNGCLRDPILRLHAGSAFIATNDSWSFDAGAVEAARMMSRLGAFPLRSGSDDAALHFELAEGSYTMHAAPADENGAEGVVLVEVYAP